MTWPLMLRRTHDLILAEERRAAGLRHLTQTTTNGGAEVHVHYIQHGDGENP